MRKLFTILSLVAICGVLSACNTISGMGRDISSGGNAVSRGADQVQQKM